MYIFDLFEIRQHIFSYVYPKIIKKNMWIKVITSSCLFQPSLDVPLQIFKIVKNEDQTYTIVIKFEYDLLEYETLDNDSQGYENRWYCVYTYLYPNHGDIIKVVKSN